MENIEELINELEACVQHPGRFTPATARKRNEVLSAYKELENKLNMKYANTHMNNYGNLFKHMSDNHGLSLTDSELHDIAGCVIENLEVPDADKFETVPKIQGIEYDEKGPYKWSPINGNKMHFTEMSDYYMDKDFGKSDFKKD